MCGDCGRIQQFFSVVAGALVKVVVHRALDGPPLLGCIRRRCDGERPPERAPESECQNIVYGQFLCDQMMPNALCISVL